MSVTKQVQGEDAGGTGGASRLDVQSGAAAQVAVQEPEWDIGFDEFLRRSYAGAKARNDVEWMRWYEDWLKNMPKDHPEEYIEKSRREFMEKIEREFEDDIKQSVDASTDALMKRHIDASTDALMKRHIDASTDALMKRHIDASTDARIDARIDARMKRHIEDATNRQIMVDNFRAFRRDYMRMTVDRSC